MNLVPSLPSMLNVPNSDSEPKGLAAECGFFSPSGAVDQTEVRGMVIITPLKINMEHNHIIEVWFRSVSFLNG